MQEAQSIDRVGSEFMQGCKKQPVQCGRVELVRRPPARRSAPQRPPADEVRRRDHRRHAEDDADSNAPLRAARQAVARGRGLRLRGARVRRVAAERPVVAAVGREDAREAVAVRDVLEVDLLGRERDGALVDDERGGGRHRVVRGAVGPARADEGRVAEERVALDGEVARGGHRHGVPERAREQVVQHRARVADVAAVLVAEPGAGPDGNADLDDHIVCVRTVFLARQLATRRETAPDGVVPNNGVCVVALPRLVVHHVDATEERIVLNPDRVVLNQCPWRAEEHDAAVRGVVDHVVSHQTIHTAHANAIRPLLERVVPAGSDVVVLHGVVAAFEGALGDVQARPAARVEGMHVLNELARVVAAHFDVRTAIDDAPGATRAIDLHVAQLDAVAVGARAGDGRRLPCVVEDGSIHH